MLPFKFNIFDYDTRKLVPFLVTESNFLTFLCTLCSTSPRCAHLYIVDFAMNISSVEENSVLNQWFKSHCKEKWSPIPSSEVEVYKILKYYVDAMEALDAWATQHLDSPFFKEF